MVTLHEVITFLVSMQISISSLQTHNVNRCGRDRKSGSAGMPRPISYAVFCLKKKRKTHATDSPQCAARDEAPSSADTSTTLDPYAATAARASPQTPCAG